MLVSWDVIFDELAGATIEEGNKRKGCLKLPIDSLETIVKKPMIISKRREKGVWKRSTRIKNTRKKKLRFQSLEDKKF